MIKYALTAVLAVAALLTSTVAAAALPDNAGMRMLQTEDCAGAAAYFGAALQRNPDDAAAAAGMATLELARQRNKAGVDWAGKAVALAPQDANWHMLLGLAYGQCVHDVNVFGRLGVARKVRDAFIEAVRLAPDNAQARAGLAKYYILAPGIAGGSVEKGEEQMAALDRIEAGLALNPANSINDYGMGQLALQGRTRLEQGMQSLRQFLALPHDWMPGTPTYKEAHVQLGKLYALAGDSAAEQAQYLAALDLDPDYEPAKAALASSMS